MHNVQEKLRQQSGPHSPLWGAPLALEAPNTGKAAETAMVHSGKDIGSLRHAAHRTVRTTLSAAFTDKEQECLAFYAFKKRAISTPHQPTAVPRSCCWA